MSADNYVVVKRFGKNDYRWTNFSASDDEDEDNASWSKSFKTPLRASKNAESELEIIEYGIRFTDDCFICEDGFEL